MQLRDAVLARRMVRAFDPDRPVAEEVVDRLLALALRAPSAGNSQGRDLLVLTDPGDRERFWRSCSGSVDSPGAWLAGMMAAPVLVVCLSDPDRYAARYAEPDKEGARQRGAARAPGGAADAAVAWPDVDTGMSAQLLLLGAIDEGLGACLAGVPAAGHDAVRAAFGVPGDRRVVCLVAVGHPAPGAASRSSRGRRPAGEVLHRGRFGVPRLPC